NTDRIKEMGDQTVVAEHHDPRLGRDQLRNNQDGERQKKDDIGKGDLVSRHDKGKENPDNRATERHGEPKDNRIQQRLEIPSLRQEYDEAIQGEGTAFSDEAAQQYPGNRIGDKQAEEEKGRQAQ